MRSAHQLQLLGATMSAPVNSDDDRPVTRGELRVEIARLEQRFDRTDARFDAFEARMDARMKEQFATNEARMQQQFETLAGALDARMQRQFETLAGALDARLQERLDTFASGFEVRMRQHIDAVADRLSGELARASLAGGEQTRREIGVVEDRYRDLPARVTLLERELDEHRRDAAAHRQARPGRKRS
jgi:DNA anti-recombination protein RmuC